MREIKFRAWDTTEEQLIDVFMMSFPYPQSLIYMQYTGLKDKNGKEIYEGDIIVATFAFGDTDLLLKEKAIVEYSSENAGFYMRSLDNKKYALFDSHYTDGYEVIGNIYENPEMV